MENKLKDMLAMRQLSVSEFARRTGISQPTMDRIVNGKVNIEGITARNFLRIAHGLGLSSEQLYYGDMSYDENKNDIDYIYATTCEAGREAMLANAYGVQYAYPSYDGCYLPSIRADITTLKGL